MENNLNISPESVYNVQGGAGTICTTSFSRAPKHFYIQTSIPHMVQIVKPLRKCRDCGLEAWTEEDLKLFRKVKNKPYGRGTWCKKCQAKDQEKYKRTKIEQELIEGFPKPIMCYFCKCRIKKLVGGSSESLIIHSLDGNHDNWDSENKTPTHRRCHTRFHLLTRNPKIYERVSRALKGIKRSPETRAKMSIARRASVRRKKRYKNG